MRKSLSVLVLLSTLAASAAHADVYLDGGLRNLTGTGHQVTAGVGADTDVGRSGLRVGVEATHSLGNTAYSTAAGVLSYDGNRVAPFIKAGRAVGDVEGSFRAIGVEYRTSPQYGGWSVGAEFNQVKLDAAADATSKGINVFARYRF